MAYLRLTCNFLTPILYSNQHMASGYCHCQFKLDSKMSKKMSKVGQKINGWSIADIDERKCGTHGWQSLTRSWSVVEGDKPRMYRLVLLSWSQPAVLLLLLLGLGGAMGWDDGATSGWNRWRKHRKMELHFKFRQRGNLTILCIIMAPNDQVHSVVKYLGYSTLCSKVRSATKV